MCEIELNTDVVTNVQNALYGQKLVKGIMVLKNALKGGPVRLGLQNLKRVTENIGNGNTRPVGDRIAVSLESPKEVRRRLWETLKGEFGE